MPLPAHIYRQGAEIWAYGVTTLQKLKLGQIFRESISSLCFDFSDSHLKTCFLQKATLSKRYRSRPGQKSKQHSHF